MSYLCVEKVIDMTHKFVFSQWMAAAAFVAAVVSCGGRKAGTQVVSQWTVSDSSDTRTENNAEPTVRAGEKYTADGDYTNFILTGQAQADSAAEAAILFHSDGADGGYEVIIHNGPIDGTRKTGSLAAVRNLYRSLAPDGQWFGFTVAVRGKNISVSIDSTEVVCYTEPQHPYRLPEYSKRLLSHGAIAFAGRKGSVRLRNVSIEALADDAVNPADTMPPVDERGDGVIRLQQQNFPVIDYHVHLKGGLTSEMAHAKEMNYGINYGVAINVGEGGVGTMLQNDQEAIDYCKRMRPAPFLMGGQGEGRRWIVRFTEPVLAGFDYIFTDALTLVDKGRICRIYRPEEVHLDGRTHEQYMDMIVDQIVKILTNEPVDFYANPTFLPDIMKADYDKLWTDARINRVLDVLQRYGIALEINSRYKLPSLKIIRMAKARGIKFTFGTNNEVPDFGRDEYAIEAVGKCGLKASDIWFPSMSRKAGRHAVDYNNFRDKAYAPIESLQ